MNKELTNIFNQNLGVQNFNSLKISIASPDDIPVSYTHLTLPTTPYV